LHRAERWFSQQRTRCSDRVDDIGLVQPTRSSLRRGSLWWDLTSINPAATSAIAACAPELAEPSMPTWSTPCAFNMSTASK
jgi:hypothetical protein